MAQACDKEKSESPTGIEPVTSRTLGGCSFHSQNVASPGNPYKIVCSFNYLVDR